MEPTILHEGFAETVSEAYARQVPPTLRWGSYPQNLATPCIESTRAQGGWAQGPVMTVKRVDGSHMLYSIRRAAWQMCIGEPQHAKRLLLESACGNARCINPAHHTERRSRPPAPPAPPITDKQWARVRAIQRREGAIAGRRQWQDKIANGERVRRTDLADEIAALVVVCGSKANTRRWIEETTGVCVRKDALRPSGPVTFSRETANAIQTTHAELIGSTPPNAELPELPDLLDRSPRTRRTVGQGAICKNGHLLDVVGGYFDARGYLQCVGCRRLHVNKSKERRRSAAAHALTGSQED